MPFYETVVIIDPTIGPEEIDKETKKVEAAVTSGGGRILHRDIKGKLQLAYQIAHRTEGYYVYIIFEGEGSLVPVLERSYRLNERILRFLTVRIEGPPLEPPKEKARKAEVVEKAAEELGVSALKEESEEEESGEPEEEEPEEEEPEGEFEEEELEEELEEEELEEVPEREEPGEEVREEEPEEEMEEEAESAGKESGGD